MAHRVEHHRAAFEGAGRERLARQGGEGRGGQRHRGGGGAGGAEQLQAAPHRCRGQGGRGRVAELGETRAVVVQGVAEGAEQAAPPAEAALPDEHHRHRVGGVGAEVGENERDPGGNERDHHHVPGPAGEALAAAAEDLGHQDQRRQRDEDAEAFGGEDQGAESNGDHGVTIRRLEPGRGSPA